MKKLFLILLLATVWVQAQTLQNPTYGNTTTNTLKLKTPSTVTSVNFLPAFDADGITVSKIDPVKLPFTDAVRTGKVFQDFASYSTYSGLGMNLMNGGVVLIGDSNSEGYNTVGVGAQNWFNITASNLQKNQGKNSGIGFTNLSDLTRYGVTKTGTTSIVATGPTNTAIQMTPNSTLEFDSATNLVEFWFNSTPSSGKLEFYYNGILYRTVDLSLSGTTNNGQTVDGATYPSVPTPSGNLGHYTIKCTTANVVITALFTKVLFSEGTDTYFFLRDGVSAKSFADFNVNNILATFGLGLERNSLFLLNLGTNSIYGGSVATTSAVFETQLTTYLNTLKTSKTNVVYVMSPRAMETSYPVIYEPYINYYNKAVSVCKNLGIEFIDLNNIYIYIPKPMAFESDGLHYSAAGHEAIANYMIKSLASIDINSRNLLQDYKVNNPVPALTGTNNFLPKKTGTNTYADSKISDDGTEVFVNSTTRIPSATALQFGTATATNFGQVFWNPTPKELTFTNSSGIASLKLNDNLNSAFGGRVSGADAVNPTEFVTRQQVQSLGVKKYRALIGQSGTSAPTVTVLENSLSGTPVWTYTSVGNYTATLSGAFTAGKTFVSINNPYQGSYNTAQYGSVNTITVSTSVTPTFILTDARLNTAGGTMITIEVYP